MKLNKNQNSVTQFGSPQVGGLQKLLSKSGRFPPITIYVSPLENLNKKIKLDRFLSYNFSSSTLIPVDLFSFTFARVDDNETSTSLIKEGDIISLTANDVPISTGIIDQTVLEVDAEGGERMTVTGRNLIGQLEDQFSVSVDGTALFGQNLTLAAGVNIMLKDTRIGTSSQVRFQNIVNLNTPYLLATEPGENKLGSLRRFLEPANAILWMRGDGTLMIGKPSMNANSTLGQLVMNRAGRQSNVLSMRATRASTQIPNIITPIWSALEPFQTILKAERSIFNNAEGPTRLRKLNHRLPYAVVTSIPTGANSKDLDNTNNILALGGNLVNGMAQREIARMNVNELQVECTLPGHYNQDANPFQIDSVYNIYFDRADVNKAMYLYEVNYELNEEIGQFTTLRFCNLGTIVANNPSFSTGG